MLTLPTTTEAPASLAEAIWAAFYAGHGAANERAGRDPNAIIDAAMDFAQSEHRASFDRLMEEGKLFPGDDGSLLRAFEEAVNQEHEDGGCAYQPDGSRWPEDDTQDPMMSREEREERVGAAGQPFTVIWRLDDPLDLASITHVTLAPANRADRLTSAEWARFVMEAERLPMIEDDENGHDPADMLIDAAFPGHLIRLQPQD